MQVSSPRGGTGEECAFLTAYIENTANIDVLSTTPHPMRDHEVNVMIDAVC
jgi:hypothetical protein